MPFRGLCRAPSLPPQTGGIAALAKGGTVAVPLPATSFYLGKPYARARDMIAAGAPVAVASTLTPAPAPV